MAVISKKANTNISPTNDYQFIGRTVIADGALSNGLMVGLDPTSGRLVEAADDALPYGVLLNDVDTGEPGYVLRWGIVDGYDVSGMSYGDVIYTGVDGVLRTDALNDGAEPPVDTSVVVGKVVSNSELGVKLVEFRFI